MIISKAVLIVSLAAAPLAAQTQSQIAGRYSQEYVQCMNTADGISTGMMDCLEAEIKVQEARINQAYVMIMRRLPQAQKASLRIAERAWIKRRDATCTRAANIYRGGSGFGNAWRVCYLDETIKRTIFLEQFK